MDKLPTLRRKPKPPAIKTAVDRSFTGAPGETSALPESPTQNHQHQHLHGSDVPKMQIPSMRKSPLRNLKLRVSAKRARTNSPAPQPSSSPVVAVFNQDGFAPRSAMDESMSFNGNHSSRPMMPEFLNTTLHDIEMKFEELTWAERNRLALGARSDAPPNFRWGSFKQTDASERGLMDRYVNIKPWNHNRVKLKVPQDGFNYVNASTIELDAPEHSSQQQPLRFIAMQGPTLPSINYVWRMVAEQTSSTAVIVQLTSMMEGGMIKCNQYFPDGEDHDTWVLNEDNLWNDGWKAQLQYDSIEDLADGAIEKRKLLLHVEGESEPRTVWHFLYTRWPDFGVPTLADMDSFFELMKISREHAEPSQPRIIHCSAGVGRTGTFISLEHLIRELDAGNLVAGQDSSSADQQPDIIYNTVDALRQQRRSMVQSEVQYRFLYQVMRKLWQDKYGIALDGHDPDGTGNSEPAAKRLEVADPFSRDSSEEGSADVDVEGSASSSGR